MLDPTELASPKSVSEQFRNAYGFPDTSISGAVSGAVKSFSDGIGSAASKLGNLGMSGISSVKTALAQFGKLDATSKFSDTFKPPSKLRSLSPEQTRSNLSKPGDYTFPLDIGDYFITLSFKKYDRKLPIADIIEIPTCNIHLPIPQNLQEQFNMSYAEKQLGVAGFIEDVLGNVIKKDFKTEAFTEAGKQVGKEVLSKQGLYYAGRTLLGLSDSIGAAVDKAAGVVLNPFQSLLFQGVSLRTHQFTYRFSPNSEAESKVLKDIIRELKIRMHPQKDGFVLSFPDICDIKFGMIDKDPYFFKTSVLDSMSVNYAAAGQPSFFANTRQPTDVEISMTFKEIEPIFREDFDQKFKTSGRFTRAEERPTAPGGI